MGVLTNLINSITTKVQGIITAKANIRTSIVNKEVEVPASATLAEMPGYIDQILIDGIDTSDATATADKILLDETAYVNSVKITGTMPNNGTVSQSLDAETTSYSIAEGYYSGGSVSVETEEKTVSPTAATQTITPTSGKLLNKVTVGAAPLENLTVNPSTSLQTKYPSSGKYGFGQVVVYPVSLETKTITDNGTFTPSGSNIGFSSVEVSIPRGILGQGTNSTTDSKTITFTLGEGKFTLPEDAPLQFIVEIAPTSENGSITKTYGIIHAAFYKISTSGGITKYSCSCYTEDGYAVTSNVTSVYNSTNKQITLTLPKSSYWTTEPFDSTSFDDVVFMGTSKYPCLHYIAALWD